MQIVGSSDVKLNILFLPVMVTQQIFLEEGSEMVDINSILRTNYIDLNGSDWTCGKNVVHGNLFSDVTLCLCRWYLLTFERLLVEQSIWIGFGLEFLKTDMDMDLDLKLNGFGFGHGFKISK